MIPKGAYDVWAPAEARWSAWAKPVLFAHMDELGFGAPLAQPPSAPRAPWAPPADGQHAIVIDLPGCDGVLTSIALAHHGFRPVPLYNALPGGGRGAAVCDVAAIITTILVTTPQLAELSLAPDAPPAFMLDAARRFGTATPVPGTFDNRSVSLPTDFPSSNLLMANAVRSVLLVQNDEFQPQPDLAHTLLRWQEAGIQIVALALSKNEPPRSITVRKPRWYRCAWQRMLATAGLRRSPLGGFGGLLPLASAGG